MSKEYVFSDMQLHALDAEEAGRSLRYYTEAGNEEGVRRSIASMDKANGKLQADLSQLDYVCREQAEAEELRRNPRPPTMELPFTS